MTPKRSVSALVGAATSLLPGIGPLIAVVWSRDARWRGGADLAVVGAIAAVAVGDLVHGRLTGLAAMVLLGWLVTKGTEGALRMGRWDPRPLALGLVVGLWVSVVAAAIQVAVLGSDRGAGTSLAAVPNLFALALLPPAVLVAVLRPRGVMAVLAGASLPIGVVASGSRSALLAVVVLVVGSLVVAPLRRLGLGAAVGLAIGIGVVFIAVHAGNAPWAARLANTATVHLATLVATDPSEGNLIRSSEVLDAAPWSPLGVTVRAVEDPGPERVWNVQKTSSDTFARVQQTVRLVPGGPYAVQMEYQPADPKATAGFLAWGRSPAGTSVLRAAVVDDRVVLTAQGSIRAITARLSSEAAWKRLTVVFTVTGEHSVTVGLGPGPDLAAGGEGSALRLRRLQLTRGASSAPYRPTYPILEGQGAALVRLDLFRVAWDGILHAPWAGQGPGTFPAYYVAHRGEGDAVPVHAHDLWLQAAFERGVLGVLAVVLLLIGWFARAPRRWRASAAVLLVAVLVANLFDATLLSGTVFYPLALVIGALAVDRDEPADRPLGPALRPPKHPT